MGAKRKPSTGLKVMAVINPAAGRAGPKALGEMRAIFDELGVKADIQAPRPAQLSAVLGAVIAARPDVLVVLAGDGTARTAAEMCGPKGPMLAPLPGGTMNMLPKALYGDIDWKQALRDTLDHGVERAVGGGDIGSHTFYCAAMLGATALFAPAREAVRSRDVRTALLKAGEAYRRAFAGRLRFETDGGHRHKAQSLTLLCPLISKVMDNDASALEVAAIDPHNAAEAMRLSARVVLSALVGDWRDDPAVDMGHARKGRVWARRSIPALLDGELVSLGRSAEFRFHAKAFRAFAPEPRLDDRPEDRPEDQKV